MSEENTEEIPLEGITDDTPDEITSWIRSNEVAENFTVMLKEMLESGGKPVYMKSYTNRCPSIQDIGRDWGPGKYKLVFSWRGENKGGKKEQMTKDMEVELPERAWREIYEEATEAKRDIRLAGKEKKWMEDAVKARAQGTVLGQATPAPLSELDVLRKALETAKGLGINIGGKTTEKVESKKTFTERFVEMVPAITALGAIVSPIAVALIQREHPKKDDTIVNTLLTHILNKPTEDSMSKQVVPFLMGSIKEIFSLKQSMEPEEKESLVERIIGKIAPLAGAALTLAMQPKAEIDASPFVQMARKDKDVQAASRDPETQAMTIQRFDKVYGFQQANGLISVAGWERPPELAENYKLYPSKGFKPDGTVDDGRTPPPDEKPSEPQDDLVE